MASVKSATVSWEMTLARFGNVVDDVGDGVVGNGVGDVGNGVVGDGVG